MVIGIGNSNTAITASGQVTQTGGDVTIGTGGLWRGKNRDGSYYCPSLRAI